MCRAHTYLISFKDTNDIYIGKTEYNNVCKRLTRHKRDKESSVYKYVQSKLNGNWSNVYIDVIDSIKMDEDLTHLLNHPLNTITNPKYNFRKYTWSQKTNDELLNHRLAFTEYFHIHNYKMMVNII